MNDKNLITKIQNDIAKSNPKIINNNDNITTIQKKFSSKYTEDISDSDNDSDLTSYKNRNLNIINQLPNKKNKESNIKIKPTKSIKSSKNIQEELDDIANEMDSKSKSKSKSKSNKKDDLESDSELPEPNIENENKNENENSEDLESEHQYEYTEELKNKVKQYVKNDDRIRELQTELKLLNGAKKISETDILKHLERLGETNINITGGKLRINQYESKEGLKEDIIKEALSEKIKDPKIIEFIFEKINEKRTSGGKVQISLKRTFERANVSQKGKKGKK